jgi:hypothetical protein
VTLPRSLQILPGHMTLGAVKQFLWRGGDEIIIQYRMKLRSR